MKTALGLICYASYLLVGIVQITATASGIQHLTGLWWLISWFIALFVGWTPLLGTSLGIYGAHSDWGWSWTGAIVLFFAMPILFALPMLLYFGIERLRERRTA